MCAAEAARPGQRSYFPALPPVAENEYYSPVVEHARKEYAKYEGFAAKLAEIGPLTMQWKERHGQLEQVATQAAYVAAKAVAEGRAAEPAQDFESEFAPKVRQYIEYREIRDGLPKTLRVYDAALATLAPEREGIYGLRSDRPPTLDASTLVHLIKLKLITSDGAKAAYDQVFTTDLSQLREQREKMQKLYDDLVAALVPLKQSLEPLASLCSGYKGWMQLPRVLNAALGRAAYVTERVNQEALARARQQI